MASALLFQFRDEITMPQRPIPSSLSYQDQSLVLVGNNPRYLDLLRLRHVW